MRPCSHCSNYCLKRAVVKRISILSRKEWPTCAKSAKRCTRFFQMWKRCHFTFAQRMTRILNTSHFGGWVCSWLIRSMSRQNCQTCQTFPSSSPAHRSMLCWLFKTSTSTILNPLDDVYRLGHWVLEHEAQGGCGHHITPTKARWKAAGWKALWSSYSAIWLHYHKVFMTKSP